jgi:nitrite reductase (NADH) small subunit
MSEHWIAVCHRDDVPPDGGACVLFRGVQIAVFHLAARDEWHAVQNRCPHWNEQVLWRGITGERDGEPKVACPMHKRTYSLRSGAALGDDTPALLTFPVRVDTDGRVFIAAPSDEILERERSLCARRGGGRAA